MSMGHGVFSANLNLVFKIHDFEAVIQPLFQPGVVIFKLKLYLHFLPKTCLKAYSKNQITVTVEIIEETPLHFIL